MKKWMRLLCAALALTLLTLPAAAEGETDMVDPAPCVHTLEEQPAVVESCETDGHESYYVCTLCGAAFADAAAAVPIDDLHSWSGWHSAKGHSWGAWSQVDEQSHQRVCAHDSSHGETAGHNWDSGTVTVEPGCETEGETLYTCPDCGAERREPIPATGHNWDSGTVTVEPGCETEGETLYTCPDCGAERRETTPATGHNWDSGTVTVQPGCETEGETLYTCPDCGAERRETTPATGHDWGAWSRVDEYTHQRVCAHDATHVEAEEHAWDEGTVTKEPTIASKGVRTYTCAVCGGTKTEELPWLPLSTKTDCRALTEVPAALGAIPELDTVEEITAALKTALKSKSSSDKMAFYDVRMLYSTDEGATWQETTAEFFPSGGKLAVIIPYPEGTNSVGYNFVAAHMFDSDEQGKTPGEIEYPTVVKTRSGLMLTMTGFSPVGISWTSAGVATGDGNDPVFWGALTVLSGAALSAALCRGRKRGRRV